MNKRAEKINAIRELTGNKAHLKENEGYILLTLDTATGTTTEQVVNDGIYRKPNERTFHLVDGLHLNHPDFPNEHKKALELLVNYF